jgi:hypothetical protein
VVGSEISVQEWQPVGKKNSQYKKNDLSLVIKIYFLNCNRGVFGILVTFPHKK